MVDMHSATAEIRRRKKKERRNKKKKKPQGENIIYIYINYYTPRYLVKLKHHISYFYNALLEYYSLRQAWCET